MAFWKRLRLTLEMIKFEHSVFALPFALTGALLAFRESHLRRARFRREAALDRGRDGGRTVGRHGLQSHSGCRYRRPESADPHAPHPGGNPEHRLCLGLRASSVLVFLLAARALNPLCLKLAPLALGWCLLLFLHQALYHFFPSDSGVIARHGAGGGVDRGDRFARSRGFSGSPRR